MLGKQWLNRYSSTDLRGTAIERSQNRQRKLDAIAAWYFDHVMESLPLMLQIALLLLGCALSRYLWEINTTVASVVFGVTAFGVIFYLFIVVAGSASESCPYQTPGARLFRHIILPAVLSAPSVIYELLVFVSSKLIRHSKSFRLMTEECRSMLRQPWWAPHNLGGSLIILFALSWYLLVDTCVLGLAMLKWLATPYWAVMCRLFMYTPPPRTRALDDRTTKLELRCILWMLQESLDRTVHLSTLKHLEPLVPTLKDFDPTLVAYCFNVFVGCISINDCEVVIGQGLEQLATVSALCFFLTISHLSVMDPTSSVLKDAGQRYNRVFPARIDFGDHRFSHAMNAIHMVFIPQAGPRRFEWAGYKPPGDEYIMVSRAIIKLVKFKCGRKWQAKVPRWVLRFALHSLCKAPLPPIPVVADCLTIIAVDLDCDVMKLGTVTLDERYVHTHRSPPF